MDVSTTVAPPYPVSVGSVGQARDRDPGACAAVYDDEADTAGLVRTRSDRPRTQEEILAAGLPRVLADCLDRGT